MPRHGLTPAPHDTRPSAKCPVPKTRARTCLWDTYSHPPNIYGCILLHRNVLNPKQLVLQFHKSAHPTPRMHRNHAIVVPTDFPNILKYPTTLYNNHACILMVSGPNRCFPWNLRDRLYMCQIPLVVVATYRASFGTLFQHVQLHHASLTQLCGDFFVTHPFLISPHHFLASSAPITWWNSKQSIIMTLFNHYPPCHALSFVICITLCTVHCTFCERKFFFTFKVMYVSYIATLCYNIDDTPLI